MSIPSPPPPVADLLAVNRPRALARLPGLFSAKRCAGWRTRSGADEFWSRVESHQVNLELEADLNVCFGST